MTTNPYDSPLATGQSDVDTSTRDELARRFTRFAAVVVDGIAMMAILLPIQFATGYIQRMGLQEHSVIEQVTMSLLGIGVFLLLNGYLLVTRGQTIGKFLTKIQIVDAKTGAMLPFSRVYVYRYLWTLPIAIAVTLVPGAGDDFLFNLVILVDALFIFGTARRCLHDYIAGSKVVLYLPGRPRAL